MYNVKVSGQLKFACVCSNKSCEILTIYALCYLFQDAMRVMRFKDESISDVLQVLAGILNLGNVTFIAGNGAQINEKFGKF